VGISIELIKKLRQETGAGVLDAKQALTSSGGDYDQAVRALKEKGLARVAKRADRETTEGRVESRDRDGKVGLLVEVNCETDFVGRNEDFIAFAGDVADHFFAVSQEGQELDEILALPMSDGSGKTPAEALQNWIASTGENMAIRRFSRYELGDRPGLIEVYLHPGNRVGVMLEVNTETAAGSGNQDFVTLVHDLALHIAALDPLCITRDDVPSETIESNHEIWRKQALDEGKPEAIVDRIIQGRQKKFFETSVLVEQPFVKDDEIKISDLVKQVASKMGEEVTVRRFERFELGESLN
jgi:elongation factor Ts